MAYATAAQFRARYHQISGQPADESLIGEMLEAATAIIDQYVGYSFGTAAAEASELVVYGDGTDYLALPAYVAGSLTTVEGPSGAITTYVERDGLLIAADGAGNVPVRRPPGILDSRTYVAGWSEGVPYTVTARWGVAAVPADIREACIQIAGRLWQGRNAGYSDVIGVEGEGTFAYQRALPNLVKMTLDSYKERSSLGVW